MTKVRAKLAEVKKVVVYVVGVVAAAATFGLLHGQAEQVALAIEAAATGAGIYQATNAKP